MPRGPDTGMIIHEIFEQIFRTKAMWKDPLVMDQLIAKKLRFSPLACWETAVQQMVRKTMVMPLLGDGEFFTLSELDACQAEMEFIFSSQTGFVKGFIDLVFYRRQKVYFLDWKTHWLEDYGPLALQQTMEAHDYNLQATLYAQAIKRHFKAPFGGAYYIFVRGGTYAKIE